MKENEKRDKYFDLIKELKKLWNIKLTNREWCTGYESPKKTGRMGNQGKNLAHKFFQKKLFRSSCV